MKDSGALAMLAALACTSPELTAELYRPPNRKQWKPRFTEEEKAALAAASGKEKKKLVAELRKKHWEAVFGNIKT